MIIDLKVANHSSLASTIINECPFGIVVTNNTGIIINANNSLCLLSGYNKNELVGADIDILTDHQNSDNSLRFLIKNNSYENSVSDSLSIRLKSSETSLQKVRMISSLNTADNERYFIFYFNNSSKPDSEVDIKSNNESLISLGKMAAYLSHEIKTPLTSIKMNIDMISCDPGLPLSRARSMKIIQNEIQRLERLSKEVLYFSRSTRNSNSSFRLSESIDEIDSLLHPQLVERDILFINNIKHDVLICGDKYSIKAMFMHLIENSIESIKQNGKITIWDDSKNTNSLIPIFIGDNGDGIKYPENIFDLFFTSKSTGTGLGLSIAKKIVEDHSGSIELISSEKGNTIFKILLPRVPD